MGRGGAAVAGTGREGMGGGGVVLLDGEDDLSLGKRREIADRKKG
jgi:hypothetical protein